MRSWPHWGQESGADLVLGPRLQKNRSRRRAIQISHYEMPRRTVHTHITALTTTHKLIERQWPTLKHPGGQGRSPPSGEERSQGQAGPSSDEIKVTAQLVGWRALLQSPRVRRLRRGPPLPQGDHITTGGEITSLVRHSGLYHLKSSQMLGGDLPSSTVWRNWRRSNIWLAARFASIAGARRGDQPRHDRQRGGGCRRESSLVRSLHASLTGEVCIKSSGCPRSSYHK